MSQNRTPGFLYNIVSPPDPDFDGNSPPIEFLTEFTIDAVAVNTPAGPPSSGTTAFTVFLDPTAAEGDKILVTDVSGNCNGTNQIVIQTVPPPPPFTAGAEAPPFPDPSTLGTPPPPPPPQATINSSTFGAGVQAIALTSPFQQVTLTFSENLNAWLSTV